MKRPTFLEGVAVAMVASFLGGALYGSLATVLPGSVAFRALVSGIGLAYVLYLLARSHDRIGRITTLAAWTVVAAATWLLEPPAAVFLSVHLGLVWLIRSVYFHASVLSAVADLGLNIASVAAAIWAAAESGSPLLSIWCFFLVQALFVGIPARMGGKGHKELREDGSDDRFEQAHRAAQSALRRLSSVGRI